MILPYSLKQEFKVEGLGPTFHCRRVHYLSLGLVARGKKDKGAKNIQSSYF